MIAWGWKGKGGQGEMAKGLGNFFFWSNESVLKLSVVMDAQLCDCNKSH